MSREEAAATARRQFGNVTMLREDRRELQTLPSIETWWHDLRYALRVLWKDRGFAVVSILTLGLGIGAATAIFSVVYNILLAPFPYQERNGSSFHEFTTHNKERAPAQGYRAAEVLEFAENNHVFDGIAAAMGERGALQPRRRNGSYSWALASRRAVSNSSACPRFTAA